jgi:hypothetical protein
VWENPADTSPVVELDVALAGESEITPGIDKQSEVIRTMSLRMNCELLILTNV